jgi:hypothetical protein
LQACTPCEGFPPSCCHQAGIVIVFTLSMLSPIHPFPPGRYLSYRRNGGTRDTRVTLVLPSVLLKPPTWRVQKLNKDSYVLQAMERSVNAPASLSYSRTCASTSVNVTRGTLQRWKITPVQASKGLYIVKAEVSEPCNYLVPCFLLNTYTPGFALPLPSPKSIGQMYSTLSLAFLLLCSNIVSLRIA